MAKFNQDHSEFGSAKPANKAASRHCAECEAMLADALDGTLSPTDQERFDLHLAGCLTCSQMLADAQRGAAWLELLRAPRPEPPAALFERILAQTVGQGSIMDPAKTTITVGDGLQRTAAILPFRKRMAALFPIRSLGETRLQPRLAMTAAMAFFSIGLTLNLVGVRLNEFHASDLKPSSFRRNFYQANAHVARYVDNMRVVYELESRVRDLQRVNDTNDGLVPAASNQKPAEDLNQGSKSKQHEQKQPRPSPGSGTSLQQEPAAPRGLASFRLVNSSRSTSQERKLL